MKFNKTQTKKMLKFKKYLEAFFDGKTLSHLSIETIDCMIYCYNEIVKNGRVETFQTDVANKFMNKGFKVTLQENGVNYLIEV